MRSRLSTPGSAASLQEQWAARSLADAWAFPSDWDAPAVEAVCEAIVADQDVVEAAARLGRARADAGVSLGEALADIDQLAGLVPARHAETLRRALSLGWADGVSGLATTILDPLTGLASREYLQQRLAEVYSACAARGRRVPEEYALVVVRLDLIDRGMWERVLPMIVVGECLRVVFDAGETLARLGEPMAVALVARGDTLVRRVQLVSSLVDTRLSADPSAANSGPQIWIEPMPDDFQSACWLLAELGR